jgi:hypothetical protein
MFLRFLALLLERQFDRLEVGMDLRRPAGLVDDLPDIYPDDLENLELEIIEEDCDCEECSPPWLHPDCAHPCLALDLGTCCGYPVSDLVGQLGDLAAAAEEIAADAGDPRATRRLAGLLAQDPGLPAAIIGRMQTGNTKEAFQLICPVERLLGAIGELRGHATAADPEHDGLGQAESTLAACSSFLWTLRRHLG